MEKEIESSTSRRANDENTVDTLDSVKDLREAGDDEARQSSALMKLGEWYTREAKTTGNCADFVKANGLFNAALVRMRMMKCELQEEVALSRIVYTYQAFLRVVTNSEVVASSEEVRDEIRRHKDFLEDERKKIKSRVEDISTDFERNPRTGAEETKKLWRVRGEKIYDVFGGIQDMLTNLVGTLIKECESVLGRAPCKYAIIALGSVGRMEATPYSDLEFAILLAEKVLGNKFQYFRILTHFLHLKIVNLGETILPTLGIKHLNDFQSTDPKANWFYDKLTPRGFSFDGAMPWASKTPLGRIATRDKAGLELIRTPQEMADLQQEDIALKEGYHLADIMSRATLLYGEGSLLDEYEQCVADKLNSISALDLVQKSSRTVGFTRGMKQLLVDNLTYDPYFSYIGRQCTIGAMFDTKKQFYRLISLLVTDLGLVFDIRAPSPWGLISGLRSRGIIDDQTAEELKVCLSLANEIRLKTYLANGGQKELLSPLPRYASSLEQGADHADSLANDPPIFRYSDEETLVRLLSISHDFCCRCKSFCTKYLEHNEVDTNLLRRSAVSSSNYIRGMLYLRLQNFPKALEFMKAEPEGSRNFPVSLSNQGIVYHQLGNLQESIKCYEKALEVHYQDENMSNLDPFICRNNLAVALMDAGQYQKAKVRFEQAIVKHKEMYGECMEVVGVCRLMLNLGLTLDHLGDYKSAIAVLEKVLTMQKTLSDDVPDIDVIRVKLQLAMSLSKVEEHVQSLRYAEEALHLSEKIFGKTSLSVELVHVYSSAGTIYEACNRHDDGLIWYKRSLEVLQQVYGDAPHPDKVSTLNNLGNFFSRRYQFSIALPYLESSLKAARAVFGGKPHPTVALVMSNVGVAWKRAKKPERAITYFEEAKEIMENALGKEHTHPTTSDVLNNLGTAYQDLGYLDKAMECYKRVLKMNTIVYGEDAAHDAMGTVCSNIACVAEEMGDLLQAKEYYTKAVDIDRQIPCTKNTCPGVVSSLYGLSSICEDLQEDDEALKHLEEAREISKAAHSKDRFVAAVTFKLGMMYLQEESIVKCKSCFSEAKKMLESLPNESETSFIIDICSEYLEKLPNETLNVP